MIPMLWTAQISATQKTSHDSCDSVAPATGRVLIAAYTVRRRDDGESIRIISARRASRKERAAYSTGSQE